jgi:DNA polymerase-3 subunit delta
MILKSFELNKIDTKKHKIILLYGKNEGHKNEIISKITKKNKNISNYEEKEILDNTTQFLESLFNQSLFDNEKLIIIKRATDKILKIIEEISEKKIDQITILINSDSLEKKSKLRIFFEKSKENLCIPFYPDNNQTLSKITSNYLSSKKIQISQININLIVSKCNGDREKLFNELNKIENYSLNGKKLDSHNISKLINLSEDHSVSELIDNCLAKNKKKTITILNENNFTTEDCILITRIFLIKLKKILILSSEFKNNNNIDLTISSARPPIFWKDKEIVKQQIFNWTPKNIKKLIYKISEIELLIKKNMQNSVNLLRDFILEQLNSKTNN